MSAAVRTAPTPVTLISDATGGMGQHVLQALFTQFPPGAFRLETITFVNSESALEQCLTHLATATGLVVHATIYPEFKRRIAATCRRRRLPVYDLTGPIMRFFVEHSGRQPVPDYAKLHELTPDYFERVAAIEFAIDHDDGGGLGTLHGAEAILTGISRTTKTPTTMLLALAGDRAANVPLVLGVAPPQALLTADPRRVICLTMTPDELAAVRAARVSAELGGGGDYADVHAIRREVIWARQLSEQQHWRLLEVTGRAVEETAARIINLLRRARRVRNGTPPRA